MRDEDFRGDERPNIMELFKCLPVIEHLTTWGYMSPVIFIHLNTLYMIQREKIFNIACYLLF